MSAARLFAVAIVVAAGLTAASLYAQPSAPPSPEAGFTDPSAGHDPFAADGGGASAPDSAAPKVDPSLGPDPFSDAGATPSSNPPSASPPSTSAPSSVPLAPPLAERIGDGPTPHVPPHRTVWERQPREEGVERDEDPDAITFGNRHARVRLLLLLQPQLIWEFFNRAASPNLQPDGTLPAGVGPNSTMGQPDRTTTNRGTFRLRRARIGLELTTDTPFGAAIEIDPNLADRSNPASGTIARRLEMIAGGGRRGARTEVGAGLFRIPFSRDIAEPHGSRIFAERAFGTRAMFPEDSDMGIRLLREIVPLGLSFQLAVLNGVTVGEPSFGRAPDLNKTKDVSGRVAVKLNGNDRTGFEAGLGGYGGQGQAIDPVNLRVQQRSRAALVLDALFRIHFSPEAPETRLLGEVVIGRNMDRGVQYPFVIALPPDPHVSLPNFDSRSAWIRLEQDFARATVGFRYDAYTPDATEPDDSRHTLAFAAARNIGNHARVTLEFDHVIDQVHPPGVEMRTKLIEVLSLMGQLRY
jgi:hypothetical protein